MEHFDYLIVGAGLYGSTYAYKQSQRGQRCLVVDKRGHLGGNVYCRREEGINIHEYGAHIFHTSDKRVWDFVNSFVEFNRYTNSPMACYKGRLYNLPFNMNTFNQMWGVTTPEEARAEIDRQRAAIVQKLNAEGASEPHNLEEQALMLVGTDIYERLIKGYTEKQWGRKLVDLPAFIIKRLPVRFVFDNNYFNDAYQGVPKGGYNVLIDGLLRGVETRTGVDFFDCSVERLAGGDGFRVAHPDFEITCSKIVYTGKIDEYFGYRYGRLKYRSVRFEHEVLDIPNKQGNAVVNYTEAEVPYTRIIEHKHFECFGDDVYANPKTVISREYPMETADGQEPYYPINDSANTALYQRYKELANKETDVMFGGRLAEYKYYDMAPVVAQVLSACPW